MTKLWKSTVIVYMRITLSKNRVSLTELRILYPDWFLLAPNTHTHTHIYMSKNQVLTTSRKNWNQSILTTQKNENCLTLKNTNGALVVAGTLWPFPHREGTRNPEHRRVSRQNSWFSTSKYPRRSLPFPLIMHRQNPFIVPGGHVFDQNLFCTERSVKCLASFLHFARWCLESIKGKN